MLCSVGRVIERMQTAFDCSFVFALTYIPLDSSPFAPSVNVRAALFQWQLAIDLSPGAAGLRWRY